MHYLEEKDLARLLLVMYSHNRQYHLAALTSLYTGARISQTCNIRGEDIFQRDDQWVIKIRPAKRGYSTVHSIHSDNDPAFDMSPLIAQAQIKRTSLLFGQIHTSNFNTALKRYAVEAGIHTDYAHSHMFRHSAAMMVYRATGHPGPVQKLLGHKSMSSAMIYLQENDAIRARTAMDNIRLGSNDGQNLIEFKREVA